MQVRDAARESTGVAKAEPRTRENTTPSLQSVEQALLLLEMLAERGEAGVSDIARALGRSPSGAFRLLTTLQRRGYVEQEKASRKYRIGVRLFQLSAAYEKTLDVRSVAHPHMVELVRRSGQMAHLAIFQRDGAVNIHTVESSEAVSVHLSIGTWSAAYATATGKALLAFQPGHVVDRVIESGLQQFGPGTITDPDALRAELQEVRRRGYALNVAGWRPGVWAVGAPIRNRHTQVIAAMSLASPLTQVDAERSARLTDWVQQTTDGISRQLGYVPEGEPFAGEGGTFGDG